MGTSACAATIGRSTCGLAIPFSSTLSCPKAVISQTAGDFQSDCGISPFSHEFGVVGQSRIAGLCGTLDVNVDWEILVL